MLKNENRNYFCRIQLQILKLMILIALQKFYTDVQYAILKLQMVHLFQVK